MVHRYSVLLCYILLSQTILTQVAGFNCSKSASCQKELDRFHIEEIKTSILSQLHLSGPPDVAKPISEKLREEYSRMAEEIDEQHVEKETETQFLAAKDPSAGEDASQLIATFDVTDNLASKELIEARLIFQTDIPETSLAQDIQVQVYEKNDDGSLGEQVVSQTMSVSGHQKIKVNLPVDAVNRWYTTSPIAGLFVSAIVNGHNVAIHPQQTPDDFENMILQLTTLKSMRRSRRFSSPICTKEKPSEGCCLYDLMIDFEKIGWDWIVAPRRYNAYICRGNCRLNAHHYSLNENGHTKIMKAAYRMGNEAHSQLENVGLCCHATDYEYVKLIYVNRDGRVSVANVNGMIARKCSCS